MGIERNPHFLFPIFLTSSIWGLKLPSSSFSFQGFQSDFEKSIFEDANFGHKKSGHNGPLSEQERFTR